MFRNDVNNKSTERSCCVLKDNFDKLDELFSVFTGDTELLDLLVDTTGMTEEELNNALNDNVRRSFADSTLIQPEETPFIDMSFIEGHSSTGNYLVNFAPIEINIYAQNYYQCSLIFKAVRRLLGSNFEDAQIVQSGQRSTPLQGIYCYSLRVKAFVGS